MEPTLNLTTETHHDPVPAATRLREGLDLCVSLIGDCAGIARDTGEVSSQRTVALTAAAKLTTASAVVARAMARLAETPAAAQPAFLPPPKTEAERLSRRPPLVRRTGPEVDKACDEIYRNWQISQGIDPDEFADPADPEGA